MTHSAATAGGLSRGAIANGTVAVVVGLAGGAVASLVPALVAAGAAALLGLTAFAVAQFGIALAVGVYVLPLLPKEIGPALLNGSLFVSGGRAVLVVLGAAVLIRMLAGASGSPRRGPLGWVLLAGAVLMLPSVFGSIDTRTSLLSYVSINGEYYLVFALVAGAASSLTSTRRLAAALVASGATLGCLGLAEAASHTRVLSLLPIDQSLLVPEQFRFGLLRVQATLPHPNFLGAVMAMLLPPAVYFLFEARKLQWRLLALLASGVMFGALLLTVSRGAVLAAVIGVGIQVLLVSVRSKRYLWLPYAGVLLLVVLVVVSPPLIDATGQLWNALFERQSSEESMAVTYRLVLLRTALEAVVRRPWTGYGLNTFSELGLTSVGGSTGVVQVASADNYYLMTLVEAGIPGLIGLIVVLGGVLVLGWRRLGRLAGDAGFGLRAALLGALVGFVVLNVTVGAYRVAQVSYVFWALAALLLSGVYRPARTVGP